MPLDQVIETRLQAAFAPEVLEVVNNSHKHAGHSSSPGTGESHFAVKISKHSVPGSTRIAQHRAIAAELKDLMGEGPIHALEIKLC